MRFFRRWRRSSQRGLGLRIYLGELERRIEVSEGEMDDMKAELAYCRSLLDRTFPTLTQDRRMA